MHHHHHQRTRSNQFQNQLQQTLLSQAESTPAMDPQQSDLHAAMQSLDRTTKVTAEMMGVVQTLVEYVDRGGKGRKRGRGDVNAIEVSAFTHLWRRTGTPV
jgi:hypothetical protein